MHHLRALAYQNHPYQWPTIGKELSHIEDAELQDVKDFFFRFYRPSNAVMVVAGNVTVEEVRRLAEKWFGPIEAGIRPERNLPQEPIQTEDRRKEVEAAVPMSAIYKAYPMAARMTDEFYSANLLTDILGHGKSSRLVNTLVKDERIFHSLNAYVTGSTDPGLLIIEGKVNQDFSLEQAETRLMQEIQRLQESGFDADEVQKVKNQSETALAGADVELLNKAINLAYFTLLGDPDGFEEELKKVERVTKEEIEDTFRRLIVPERSNTLLYKAIPQEDEAED